MSTERAMQQHILESPICSIPDIIKREPLDEHMQMISSDNIEIKNIIENHSFDQTDNISELTITTSPETIITGNSRRHNNIIIYKDFIKGQKNPSDEELTPLTWLQDKHFIRGLVNNNNSDIKFQTTSGDKFDNNNTLLENENLSALGATTTIHIGPSGTTTLIEYSSKSNFSPATVCVPQTTIQANPNQQYTYKIEPTTSIKKEIVAYPFKEMSTIIYNNPIECPTPTPTHHPHKKYIREQMNNSVHEKLHINTNVDNLGNDCIRYSLQKTPTTPVSSSSDSIKYIDNVNRSPSTFSTNSQETDSLKDFDIKTFNNKITHKTSQAGNVKQQKLAEPYDPQVHILNKPPYSFSSLIFMAIEDSPEKALPVKEIYAWIVMHFPYFKTAPAGWKNSVRHNLSLNKSFVKVEKAPNMGKGSLWRVEPSQRNSLLQSLSRSPIYSGLNKITKSSSDVSVKSQIDANLFPKLSKKIGEFEKRSTFVGNDYEEHAEESFVENLDDVKAATAMLALKHGAKVFSRDMSSSLPVITYSPSEDHTYSAGNSTTENAINDGNTSAISVDTSYESSEDCMNKSLEETEEKKRQRDGVDALLSLSKMFDISPIKRPASSTVEEEHMASYMDNITHVHAIC